MILVWFVYGLAFFVLGLVILVYPKKGSKFDLAQCLWMVGVFGIVHGLNEWLDMFIRIGGPLPPDLLAWVRMFVLPVSFFWLVLFGATILSRNAKRRRLLQMVPLLLAAGMAGGLPAGRTVPPAPGGEHLVSLPAVPAGDRTHSLGTAARKAPVPSDGVALDHEGLGRCAPPRLSPMASLRASFVRRAAFFPASSPEL